MEEFNVSAFDVKGMEKLSVQGCLNAVIPFGIYEGMGHQESAGQRELVLSCLCVLIQGIQFVSSYRIIVLQRAFDILLEVRISSTS